MRQQTAFLGHLGGPRDVGRKWRVPGAIRQTRKPAAAEAGRAKGERLYLARCYLVTL